MPAASASSRVVMPAKPLRANSGTAARTIALRRSSLSSRVIAMTQQSKRSLTNGQPATRLTGSDGDLLDPAGGQPEDPVLRHRQPQCLGARQPGKKTAQYAGHHAMANDDDRAIADL